MATTPFRILQRRSSVSGLVPEICTLSSGELFVQLADESIYFRNDKDELVCALTDKNLGNLCNIFAPTGDYITNSQTGAFAPIGNYVIASQTGVFALSADTGSFVAIVNGHVPSQYLPSYVDDIQEFDTTGYLYAHSGEKGHIYLVSGCNSFWRWGGSQYVEIYASPGTSDSLVEGSTNLYFTAARSACYVTISNTGNFVTTSQTGVFALSADTGSFVTTSQTGSFLTIVGNVTNATSINFGNANCNLNSAYSFLGRGEFNSQSGVLCSFLGGGTTNTQRASGASYCGCVSRSFLGAGWSNIQENIQTSFLGAGRSNLQIGSVDSFIGAGEGNRQRNNNWSFIGAGEFNCQSGNNRASTVGGASNWILGTENSFIGGGCFNCMSGSFNSSILGGFSNRITGGENVFVLGCEIIANNACNTLFVNNLTSVNGIISGNGAGITGLATGNFISSQAEYLDLKTVTESTIVCNARACGTINIDLLSGSSYYYINNSTGKFILNLRGNASRSFNCLIPVNKAVTVSFLNTNGSIAYELTGLQIDSNAVTSSFKWVNGAGGSFPSGNANAIDIYSITVIKTGNCLYSSFGSTSFLR